MEKMLKGDEFLNRYRINGQLTTISPLHIGTGEELSGEEYYSPEEIKGMNGDTPKVTRIVKDAEGNPYIPGSSIRGVIRHWLANILVGIGNNWATTRNYRSVELTELSQNEQIEKIRNDFSALEILFGTPLHQGKVDFWDLNCKSTELSSSGQSSRNSENPLYYMDTSVAIDPETGTALKHMLYNTEVVYPGVSFELNIVGQNLDETELGILLFGLQGFNSYIYPIRIGARGGRGYGRFDFSLNSIYYLDKNNINDWTISILNSFSEKNNVDDIDNIAGYYSLQELMTDEQDALLSAIKEKMKKEWDK